MRAWALPNVAWLINDPPPDHLLTPLLASAVTLDVKGVCLFTCVYSPAVPYKWRSTCLDCEVFLRRSLTLGSGLRGRSTICWGCFVFLVAAETSSLRLCALACSCALQRESGSLPDRVARYLLCGAAHTMTESTFSRKWEETVAAPTAGQECGFKASLNTSEIRNIITVIWKLNKIK